MTATQRQTESPESRARGSGPSSGPKTPLRDGTVDDPLYPLPPSRNLLEIQEMMAWSRERHDVEMRMRALAVELDRAMASLQALLERYDELQARRASAEPHLHRCEALPKDLETAVALGRERLQARWPS